MRKWPVPFFLVAVILSALILAVLIFYFYHDETLVGIALLLLIIFALSLRVTRLINLFRPRRQQSQSACFKNLFVETSGTHPSYSLNDFT